MRKTVRKTIIATTATVIVLLLTEAAVRFAGLLPEPWPSADGMQFPQIHIDPLLGPLPKPGFSGSWFGFPVVIDNDGFRSTGFPPLSPMSPKPTRVAFVGDSCTFGWGVATADTYIAQLDAIQRERGVTRLDLRNAGYPGQTAVVGQYMVRARVLPWDPDVVVIGFSANNAFRFSLASDVTRFRFFNLRKLFLRSRLFHILAAKFANQRARPGHPRNRAKVVASSLDRLFRVASEGEFQNALRTMITDTRDAGAEPVILLFPRASQVSREFAFEDTALSVRRAPLATHDPKHEYDLRELGLLEYSCLDHRSLSDPIGSLRELVAGWKPVYPDDPAVRAALRDGALAYVSGDLTGAIEIFGAAVSRLPDSPLAHYDLGTARLAVGETVAGLRELSEADGLACNVFLRYQVLVRRIAAELGVRVIDLALYFQTRDGEKLFLDAAHPNAAGNALIARALWANLTKEHTR